MNENGSEAAFWLCGGATDTTELRGNGGSLFIVRGPEFGALAAIGMCGSLLVASDVDVDVGKANWD